MKLMELIMVHSGRKYLHVTSPSLVILQSVEKAIVGLNRMQL